MTRRLILISLFCVTMQPVFCQDMSDARADLAIELINKQKEQAALEQKIIAQSEVVEQFGKKFKDIYCIFQTNKRDQMISKSLFAAIYNTLPINPFGFERAYKAEAKRILNSSFEECETTVFSTREQLYLFKFYGKKYIAAQDDLEALVVNLEKIDQEINEIKKKLN